MHLKKKEILVVCHYFGFNDGTIIVEDELIEKKKISYQNSAEYSIFCQNRSTALENCKIQTTDCPLYSPFVETEKYIK